MLCLPLPLVSLAGTICFSVADFQISIFKNPKDLTTKDYRDDLVTACAFGEASAINGEKFYEMIDRVTGWYSEADPIEPDAHKGLLAAAVNGYLFTQHLIENQYHF